MHESVYQLDHGAVAVRDSRLPPPVLTHVGGNRWRLEEAYEYRDGEHLLTVPEHFIFDLATVPRPLWWLIAPFELSIAAPLIHDFLYHDRGDPPAGSIVPYRTYTRKETDQLFERIMRQEAVPAWRRKAAYAAVRAFGGRAWGR